MCERVQAGVSAKHVSEDLIFKNSLKEMLVQFMVFGQFLTSLDVPGSPLPLGVSTHA